jgi:hypothetical protein
MARLIVIADSPPAEIPRHKGINAPVLMDEEVKPEHLADEHTSHQIVERMAWAVLDAQEATAARTARRNLSAQVRRS